MEKIHSLEDNLLLSVSLFGCVKVCREEDCSWNYLFSFPDGSNFSGESGSVVVLHFFFFPGYNFMDFKVNKPLMLTPTICESRAFLSAA